MSVVGSSIRLIVHEPSSWSSGNLFGTIIDQRKNIVIVKLSKDLIGNKFTSNLLKLEPVSEKEKFKQLEQYYSVMVNGILIDKNSDAVEEIIRGSVTFD